MMQTAVPRALALAAYAFTCVFLCNSMAYGRHWDEFRMIESLRTAVTSGSILPHWYNYPSLSFDLSLLSLLVFNIIRNGLTLAQAPLLQSIVNPEFTYFLRGVFAVVTLSTSLWLYGLAALLLRNEWFALGASLLLLSSYEVLYHARWVAPDGLVMSFATFAFFLASVAYSTKSRKALGGAVFGAALATSAKYPGGISFIPVMLAVPGTLGIPCASLRALKAWSITIFSFGVLCLLITPGYLFESGLVFHDIAFEISHYAVDGHGVYNVDGFFDHAKRYMTYLFVFLLPIVRRPELSLVLVLVLIIGLISLIRWDRRFLIVAVPLLLVFPLFIFNQRVMIVRNSLIIAPLLFLCVTAGIAALCGTRSWVARSCFVLGLLVYAGVGLSIRRHESLLTAAFPFIKAGNAMCTEIAKIPADRDLVVSQGILATASSCLVDKGSISTAELLSATAPLVPGVSTSRAQAIFNSDEIEPNSYIGNTTIYDVFSFGPFETNWNAYPTWVGYPRPLLIDIRPGQPESVLDKLKLHLASRSTSSSRP